MATTKLHDAVSSLQHHLSHRANHPMFRNPIFLTSAAAAVAFTAWAVYDYHDWLAFGVGGSKPTVMGWTLSRTLTLVNTVTGTNLLQTSDLSSDSTKRYIPDSALPVRKGPRPQRKKRHLPHRTVPVPIVSSSRPGSITGKAEAEALALTTQLSAIIPTLVAQYPDKLELRPSRAEGGSTPAIYALPASENPTLNPIAHRSYGRGILDRELAHVHPQDRSLHVWVSESDAKAIIERGWGERFTAFKMDIPVGYILVYPPRNMDEVKVVEAIVTAAVAYVAGAGAGAGPGVKVG